MNVKNSISWFRVVMLAVYTLSSKKRNVLVDPNMYEYNLQSMSRDKSKSFWNCVEKRKHSKCVATAVVKESDNIIISLSNNHNHNINHAKCSASAMKKSILAMLWPTLTFLAGQF